MKYNLITKPSGNIFADDEKVKEAAEEWIWSEELHWHKKDWSYLQKRVYVEDDYTEK